MEGRHRKKTPPHHEPDFEPFHEGGNPHCRSQWHAGTEWSKKLEIWSPHDGFGHLDVDMLWEFLILNHIGIYISQSAGLRKH